jgi:signal peptidase II
VTSASPTPPVGGTADTAGPVSRVKRLLLVLVLAAVIVGLDLATKQWALSGLADGRTITLPTGFIHLHLLVNAGAAFSFATGETWFITVCASAAVLAIPWFAWRSRSWLLVVALGLLLGGAAGNLIDRLARAPGPGRGRVVDFIDYHGWFTGNVADIAIVVSAALLIVRAIVISNRERRAALAPRPAQDDKGGDPAKAA